MSYEPILKKAKRDLEKVVVGFTDELGKMRTSRPSTSLVEDIKADCFGKKMPIKSLGLISLTKEREIIIKPWDSSYLESIEKAIHASDLGLSPIVNDDKIRIPFPSLSQERREKYIKILAGKSEEAKNRVRDVRNKSKKKIESVFSKGGMGEDAKFRGLDKLQELVDETNDKIEEIREEKKKRIEEV